MNMGMSVAMSREIPKPELSPPPPEPDPMSHSAQIDIYEVTESVVLAHSL